MEYAWGKKSVEVKANRQGLRMVCLSNVGCIQRAVKRVFKLQNPGGGHRLGSHQDNFRLLSGTQESWSVSCQKILLR